MGAGTVLTYGAALVTGVDSGVSIAGDRTPVNIISNTGQIIAAYFSPIPGATIAIAPGAAIMTFARIRANPRVRSFVMTFLLPLRSKLLQTKEQLTHKLVALQP